MFQALGTFCGYLYCFYCICFRWDAVRSKYGRFDLIFWAYFIILTIWFIGFLLDVAVFFAFGV